MPLLSVCGRESESSAWLKIGAVQTRESRWSHFCLHVVDDTLATPFGNQFCLQARCKEEGSQNKNLKLVLSGWSERQLLHFGGELIALGLYFKNSGYVWGD